MRWTCFQKFALFLRLKATLLFTTSCLGPGELAGSWGSIVFRRASMHRKGLVTIIRRFVSISLAAVD